MGKYIEGKSFRAHHKSIANISRNKRERLFDGFKEEFLGDKESPREVTHANDNTTAPYKG